MTLLAVLLLIVGLYFHARILWIKRFEMVVLNRSPSLFTHLPPFFEMVVKRPFVWEETEFLPNIGDMRYE